ncbi:hypothetical protein [Streptomyces sp. NPDC001678]|uniref:hypothetical protein n=1 Tax=Streptomyces sp. NPDC001678 TaxID=3364599 RepID=UPI0036A4F29D
MTGAYALARLPWLVGRASPQAMAGRLPGRALLALCGRSKGGQDGRDSRSSDEDNGGDSDSDSDHDSGGDSGSDE